MRDNLDGRSFAQKPSPLKPPWYFKHLGLIIAKLIARWPKRENPLLIFALEMFLQGEA